MTNVEGNNTRFEFGFPLLQRFPGLDYADTSNWSVYAGDSRKIRTICWLTALDKGFVSELGGMEAILNALGHEIPVKHFDGGIVIQAGPNPQLGDRNRGSIPPHYRQVAAFLKPLMFRDFKFGIFPIPVPLNAQTETEKWLNRFEA